MARLRLLVTSLDFLRIQSPELRFYQWVLPTILALVSVIALYSLPAHPPLFGGSGLVAALNSLLATLIGFYIAALAAVATFKKETLDEPMIGRPAILWRKRGGVWFEEALTRRRFLALLFGYCSLVSIGVFGAGILGGALAPILPNSVETKALKALMLFAYFWGLFSLLVATLIGLHYLVDRMHRD